MAVAAKKLDNRAVYEVTYDGASGEGAITATFTNPDNDDVSQYKGLDDGKFIVVRDGEGTAEVTIENVDGEVVDQGEVTFG